LTRINPQLTRPLAVARWQVHIRAGCPVEDPGVVTRLCRITGLLLVASVAIADAAPLIPSSELPGRERERFMPSPLDRFTDPLASPRNAEPLWRWCDQPARRRSKKLSERGRGC